MPGPVRRRCRCGPGRLRWIEFGTLPAVEGLLVLSGHVVEHDEHPRVRIVPILGNRREGTSQPMSPPAKVSRQPLSQPVPDMGEWCPFGHLLGVHIRPIRRVVGTSSSARALTTPRVRLLVLPRTTQRWSADQS